MSESPSELAHESSGGNTFGDDELASMSAASPQTVRTVGGGTDAASRRASVHTDPSGISWQLDLNEHNLHSFEATVQSGKAPLRTDIVDSRDFKGAGWRGDGDTPASAGVNSKGSRQKKKRSSREHEKCNDSMEKPPSHGSGAGSLFVNGEREAEDHEDADSNPLNVDNLKLLVKELSSGNPVVLRPENISLKLDTSPELHYNVSLLVGPPSDTSRQGEAGASSPAIFTQDGDPWSSHYSNEISETSFHRLSRDNLLQLKCELESGSIPLRPELLAGLENFMRAIGEPINKADAMPGEALEREQAEESKSEEMHEPPTAVMSFHSMLVEGPHTEIPERIEDRGSFQDFVNNPLQRNRAAPEEDEPKSTIEDSCDGNYSNTTDNEETIALSDMKSKHSMQYEMLGDHDDNRDSRYASELKDCVAMQMTIVGEKLELIEKAMSKIVLSQQMLYDQLCRSLPSTDRKTPYKTFPLTVTIDKGNHAAWRSASSECLLPCSPSSTIFECKQAALTRLQRAKLVDASASPQSIQAFMKGKLIFDEDTLESLRITSSDSLHLRVL